MNSESIHFFTAYWGKAKIQKGASNVCAVAHTIFAISAYAPILQKCLSGSIPNPLNYLVTELIVKLASPSADTPSECGKYENLNALPEEKFVFHIGNFIYLLISAFIPI